MDAPRTLAPWLMALRNRAVPFARPIAAIVAGLAITFTQNHSNITGLSWMLVVVATSLAVMDGPRTLLNSVTWWICLFVFIITGIGVINGTMSSAGTLSLIMALAAFETARAFARRDRIWAASTGLLVVALSVVYFTTPEESPMPSGLIGAWAIVAGVFSAIAVIDALIKRASPSPVTVERPVAPSPSPAAPRPRGQRKASDRGSK